MHSEIENVETPVPAPGTVGYGPLEPHSVRLKIKDELRCHADEDDFEEFDEDDFDDDFDDDFEEESDADIEEEFGDLDENELENDDFGTPPLGGFDDEDEEPSSGGAAEDEEEEEDEDEEFEDE